MDKGKHCTSTHKKYKFIRLRVFKIYSKLSNEPQKIGHRKGVQTHDGSIPLNHEVVVPVRQNIDPQIPNSLLHRRILLSGNRAPMIVHTGTGTVHDDLVIPHLQHVDVHRTKRLGGGIIEHRILLHPRIIGVAESGKTVRLHNDGLSTRYHGKPQVPVPVPKNLHERLDVHTLGNDLVAYELLATNSTELGGRDGDGWDDPRGGGDGNGGDEEVVVTLDIPQNTSEDINRITTTKRRNRIPKSERQVGDRKKLRNVITRVKRLHEGLDLDLTERDAFDCVLLTFRKDLTRHAIRGM